MARADAQTRLAENKISEREADVVKAQQIADEAKATAATGEELAHVGALQANVGAREADVGGARAALGGANASQSSANYQLSQARRDNAELEARSTNCVILSRAIKPTCTEDLTPTVL